MGHRTVRVELNGPSHLTLCTDRIPVVPEEHPGERDVRFGQAVVELQRLEGGRARGRRGLGRRDHLHRCAEHPALRIGDPRMGQRVVRVDGDGPLEVLDAAVQVGTAPVVAAADVRLVRFDVDRSRAGEAGALLRCERDLDLIRDGARHLALQVQHVAQVALVGVCPQVPVRGRMDELRRNAHPLACSHHRALDDTVHAQLARDLRHRLRRALVVHGRRA